MTTKTTYSGVDVSTHNGAIDWRKVSKQIDFAILRAGYGNNNKDKMLIANIAGCNDNSLPFGLYWFSYALNINMARNEADYICNIADIYKPQYPICYDWEYDSDDYARKCGYKITEKNRADFADAFLSRVAERGYQPMLYTNVDYINKGFKSIIDKYDIWLAHWDTDNPGRDYQIWQTTSKGEIDGIKGYVDLNVSIKDYANNSTSIELKESEKDEIIKVLTDVYNKYFRGKV